MGMSPQQCHWVAMPVLSPLSLGQGHATSNARQQRAEHHPGRQIMEVKVAWNQAVVAFSYAATRPAPHSPASEPLGTLTDFQG